MHSTNKEQESGLETCHLSNIVYNEGYWTTTWLLCMQISWQTTTRNCWINSCADKNRDQKFNLTIWAFRITPDIYNLVKYSYCSLLHTLRRLVFDNLFFNPCWFPHGLDFVKSIKQLPERIHLNSIDRHKFALLKNWVTSGFIHLVYESKNKNVQRAS